MMKRPAMTSKEAYERMMTIQRQNAKRHKQAALNSKLRMEIQQHQTNRNRQIELDRLRAASLRGNGLDTFALKRMGDLQKMVVNK